MKVIICPVGQPITIEGVYGLDGTIKCEHTERHDPTGLSPIFLIHLHFPRTGPVTVCTESKESASINCPK